MPSELPTSPLSKQDEPKMDKTAHSVLLNKVHSHQQPPPCLKMTQSY